MRRGDETPHARCGAGRAAYDGGVRALSASIAARFADILPTDSTKSEGKRTHQERIFVENSLSFQYSTGRYGIIGERRARFSRPVP
jgi:hypothetical protein